MLPTRSSTCSRTRCAGVLGDQGFRRADQPDAPKPAGYPRHRHIVRSRLGVRRQGARRMGGALEQDVSMSRGAGLSKRFGAANGARSHRSDGRRAAPSSRCSGRPVAERRHCCGRRRLAGPTRGLSSWRARHHPNAAAQAQRRRSVPILRAISSPDSGGNVAFGLKSRRCRSRIAAAVQRALSLVHMALMRPGRSPRCRAANSSASRLRARSRSSRRVAVRRSVSRARSKLREEMQVELRRLLSEIGATAIFVTHDQDEALTMSDRVAVMIAAGSNMSPIRSRSMRARALSSPCDSSAFLLNSAGR